NSINVTTGTLTITNSIIRDNNSYGINASSGGVVSVSGSEIRNNKTYGFYHGVSPTSSASAQHNWWGDASGPHNTSTNPSGTGSPVSSYVDYANWALTAEGCGILSGTITANTTWDTSCSPYIVTSTITINSGVKVTVDPGVIIKFKDNTNLIVNCHLPVNAVTSPIPHPTDPYGT